MKKFVFALLTFLLLSPSVSSAAYFRFMDNKVLDENYVQRFLCFENNTCIDKSNKLYSIEEIFGVDAGPINSTNPIISQPIASGPISETSSNPVPAPTPLITTTYVLSSPTPTPMGPVTMEPSHIPDTTIDTNPVNHFSIGKVSDTTAELYYNVNPNYGVSFELSTSPTMSNAVSINASYDCSINGKNYINTPLLFGAEGNYGYLPNGGPSILQPGIQYYIQLVTRNNCSFNGPAEFSSEILNFKTLTCNGIGDCH